MRLGDPTPLAQRIGVVLLGSALVAVAGPTAQGTYVLDVSERSALLDPGSKKETPRCGDRSEKAARALAHLVVKYTKTVLVNREEWLLDGLDPDGAVIARKPTKDSEFMIQVHFSKRGAVAEGLLSFAGLQNGKLVCADGFVLTGKYSP